LSISKLLLIIIGLTLIYISTYSESLFCDY